MTLKIPYTLLPRWFLAGCVIAFLLTCGSVVLTSDNPRGEITGFTAQAGNTCAASTVSFPYVFMGARRDTIAFVLWDSNGKVLGSAARLGSANGAPRVSFSLDGISARQITLGMYDIPTPEGDNLVDIVAASGQMIDLKMLDLSGHIADCGNLPEGTGDAGVTPVNDGRVGNVGMMGAIYTNPERIVVYGIDERGKGFTAAFVFAEDIPEGIPVRNLLLAQSPDGRYAIYRLTTGEYQVNVGPNEDGKVYVVIFEDLSGSGAYTYTFEAVNS